MVILIVIMFAFAAGLTKVYEATERSPENVMVLDAFGSFGRCLRTTYWALFGLINLDTLDVSGYRAETIQSIGEIMFGLYMVRWCLPRGHNPWFFEAA